ncbi:MAG TPA: CaiB/BaiF CoA-transferase family protein [Egibacteraceae bacterium]|mgnify:CR=1 FL=1
MSQREEPMSRADDTADAPTWAPGPPRRGPLAGLRVLDLSRILAGPFATMLLADLGADVIKVEAPGRGDETRRWGPPFAPDGTAAYFLAVNRNKRSLTLDLADPEAGAIARRLAAAADVVVDNFLPGRTARFGLDRASLAAVNPRVVTCTISGYARGSAEEDRPGFDFLAQAAGGLMTITGPPGGEPTKVGVAVADLGAGLFAAVGILAALVERAQTGRGREVEVPLLDAAVGLLANQAMSWLVAGHEPQRLGNAHPSIAPYESYATADRPIAIGAGTDRQFRRLVEALGIPDAADDPRFARNADRVANRDALREVLEAALTTRGRDAWLARLHEVGVPAAPINSLEEVFATPGLAARLVAEVDGLPQVRSPLRVDRQPTAVDSAPPALGADTDAVLAALGVPAERVAALRARGVI